MPASPPPDTVMSPTRSLAVASALALVAALGCGPGQAPVSPSTAEQPRTRSAFFTALEGEPKANKLKDRFTAKFPAYTFQVVAAERTTGSGSSLTNSPRPYVSVSVTLVVKNPGPKFEDEVGPLLAELQAYLEEQVEKCGMELNGPVEQHKYEAKPSGFLLGYRTATHKGGVIVSRPTLVPGGLEMRIYELE